MLAPKSETFLEFDGWEVRGSSVKQIEAIDIDF